MKSGPGTDSNASSAKAPCVADGGCSYLRTLGIIEHLAGFDGPAERLFAMAARCRREGCWAASGEAEPAASAPALVTLPQGRKTARPPKAERSAEVVSFPKGDAFDLVSDSEGNYVGRRNLKPAELKRIASLDYLLEYWRWLRSSTHCQFANVDTAHLMRSGIIGKLHLVDVSSSDPRDFTFELAAYAIPVPWPHHRKLGHFPIAIYGAATMHDYNTVRLTAAPRLQRMRAHLGGTVAHYTRLILPFFDDGGRVSRLAVAIHRERGDGAKVALPAVLPANASKPRDLP